MDDTTHLCVTPPRKRTWTPGSITNAYSSKRRRISIASVDFGREFPSEENHPSLERPASVADRFISARPELALPLNTTPRTQRIAKNFGLAGDRLLKYTDAAGASGSREFGMHRTNFLQLLPTPLGESPVSASANIAIRKQFILALDAPGVPADPYTFPLSWSTRNVIAVACGQDVYYQSLDTRRISHLTKIDRSNQGRLSSIEWAHDKPENLAVGTTMGSVHLWDADTQKCLRKWQDFSWTEVGGMHWKGEVLAAGVCDGGISLWDSRVPQSIGRLTLHKSHVHGVRWSTDGNYMASGDKKGIVHIWDSRAGKTLTDRSKWGGRMKHHAPVKALAWCPWKPDLLATGSMYPDGKIRIWNVNTAASAPKPLHVLPLDTSVTSLAWSPHCKELLSTHGISWLHRSADSGSSRQVTREWTKTPYTNSITVHSFPSLRCIVSAQAHMHAVGQSCLGPDGTMVFTLCPAEEAMKMWKIWGTPEKPRRRETIFDKYGIR